MLPTRVKEEWKSVPITPMWHNYLITHSNSSTAGASSTAVLITIDISGTEAVPIVWATN